ncbi:hypothetical protein EV130_10818 [Rhizobium azibense]|uniref:Uncharacterized protein n=1 Tax=Rhizobium azibense TaxID=1136135 RepID=A0A4R3RNJ0_9HYPH|nr:hypothetical protein [Rhizobium azibense]TCU22877.1 hypothetical protein EV130_10818 [Rhizobium azibense]TCU36454.1 hypothetical protein EV129_10718 [Rhizobium azibense]
MGVLEMAIASLIWARHRQESRDELYETDTGQILGRMMVAFAVFAVVIAGLEIAAASPGAPQMIADRTVAEVK